MPCHISVWDNEGKEITCTVPQEERPDVNCVLSIDETVECGFTVEIPKKYLAKGNITLLFQKKDAKAKYTLTARKMQFENSRFGPRESRETSGLLQTTESMNSARNWIKVLTLLARDTDTGQNSIR